MIIHLSVEGYGLTVFAKEINNMGWMRSNMESQKTALLFIFVIFQQNIVFID
jgi:hypothetical protein